MPKATRDRATPAQERDRILRSRDRFWRPEDLATSGSTTLHLLADLADAGELRRIRRGLYWRGTKSPLGMGLPRTEDLVRELAPGPGVGPTGLYAANMLRLSTQVPRRAEIAVPHRAPREERSIRFAARPARTGRLRAGLNPSEVAFLEVLASWESVIELSPAQAWERLLELLASSELRAERLARASRTEPASTRARLRELLRAHGRADLAEQVPAPDERTTAAATRVLDSVA
jgi:hypothetical protein